MLSGQPPSSMNSGMLSAVATPWSETKAGSLGPSMLDAWSKPSSLERTADFDSDSDSRSEPLDNGADLLELGDVDCDAFLQTLLCA